MSRTFFIADTHFNHDRIIHLCKRPFSNVYEMNRSIIDNWNSIVDEEDIVWVLGDYFYFPEVEKSRTSLIECRDITNKLKGDKRLVLGNHDTQGIEYYSLCGFSFVSPYPVIFNNFYILSHEPLQLTETTPYFNLYGHVHNDEKYKDTETSKCVSVERIDYRPIQMF